TTVIEPAVELDLVGQPEPVAPASDGSPVRASPDEPDARGPVTQLAERQQEGLDPLGAIESAEEECGPAVPPRHRLPLEVEELRRHAVVDGMNAVRRHPVRALDQLAAVAARRRAHVGPAE